MTTTRAHLVILFSTLAVWGCSSPLPTLQWEHTGGPYAQNISSLLIDRDSPATLFAGLSNGELYLSHDNGRTWTVRFSFPHRKQIFQLVQHPEIGSRLYAATEAGLFVSEDAGAQWNPVPVSGNASACRSLAIDPFDPAMMYAGLDGYGIFRSTDGGTRWDQSAVTGGDVPLSDALPFFIAIDLTNPDRVYAALSRAGVIKSTDRGTTWQMLTKELAASGMVATHLVIHAKSGNLLCFGTAAGDIYRSSNGGATWSPVRQGTGSARVGTLTPDPSSPDMLYAGTERGVIFSTNFGASWSGLSNDLPRIPHKIAASSAGSPPPLFAFGEGIGLKRSVDAGRTWQPADRGLGWSSVPIVATGSDGSRIYCTVGGAVFLYVPGSKSWVSASSGLHGGRITSIAFDGESDSLMYAGTETGIFSTTNAGVSWSPMGGRFGATPAEFFDTHPSILTRMFLQTPKGLHVSTDRGATWNPVRPFGNQYDVHSLTFSPKNSGMVHAATHAKGIVGSTDGGLSWESNRYGIKSDDILAIAYDHPDVNLLYAWTADGEGYRSTNHGVEWERYTPPWNVGDKVFIAVKRAEPHKAAALVNNRLVFVTMNAGATWRSVEAEALTAEMLTLHWSSDGSTLLAGTRDRGVYRLVLGKPGE